MLQGLLIINLGTPEQCNQSAVRKYLREFLSDKRVITLSAPLRYILLYGIILPFRTAKATHAYKSIWTTHGSPLLINSQKILNKLRNELGKQYKIELGMRYGNPSIAQAMEKLSDCEHLTILPLYPQYSSAATGSSLEKALTLLAKRQIIPSTKIISDFYQNQAFIDAQAQQILPYLTTHEYILFSYHGLPEQHLKDMGCRTICKNACPISNTSTCYRAQCMHTSDLVAKQLNLNSQQYSTSFQSRLGRTPWIKPYTDETLSILRKKGIKNIAVSCPSFVADCLETLEEIGMRAQEQWIKLGGEQLTLIPSLNDNDAFIHAIMQIIAG